MKHYSLKKRITYNKDIIEKLFNTHTAAIRITASEDCTATPGTDTPLSSFIRILVYSQELLTEVIEKLHIIHEITLEEALWLLHATIQPLHADFLPNLRRTFQCSSFKVDGSTQSHEYLYFRHLITILHNPLLLFRRTHTNDQHICTTLVHDANQLLTFFLMLLEAKGRRMSTNHHLAPYLLINALHGLNRNTLLGTKQENLAVCIILMIHIIRGEEAGTRNCFLDWSLQQLTEQVEYLAVTHTFRLLIHIIKTPCSSEV